MQPIFSFSQVFASVLLAVAEQSPEAKTEDGMKRVSCVTLISTYIILYRGALIAGMQKRKSGSRCESIYREFLFRLCSV